MAKIILASHGGLSKGMKDSVSMIVGDLARDIETYSLLPGQNPEDFYQEVLKEARLLKGYLQPLSCLPRHIQRLRLRRL